MKKIKTADTPAAENTVAFNAEIQKVLNDFEEKTKISLTDDDKKMIQTFINRRVDELDNLSTKWTREIMKATKKAHTQAINSVSNLLSMMLFDIEFKNLTEKAEYFATIGFIPQETVQAMKEAF